MTRLMRLSTFFALPLLVAVLFAGTAQAQHPTAVTSIVNAAGDTTLEVNFDGGLLAPGRFDSPSDYGAPADSIPAEGAGSRLMWYPAKVAFRAGRVDGSQWNADSVGEHSTAFGRDVIASGEDAFAAGDNVNASGSQSVAMGDEAKAWGNGSVAVGFNATASGNVALAFGSYTSANDYATTAFGESTTASAGRATAMGLDTEANGDEAVAMGNATTASGSQAVAMGERTTAATDQSVSMGTYNASNTSADGTLLVVGNGTSSGSSDALVLDNVGNLEIAGSLTQSSDRRLKTDIAPLGDGVLSALLKIRPVRYQFKAGNGHPSGAQIGLIAQEVRKEFPEVVHEGQDGYLSVAYPKLTSVLLKGVQEQQATIETQQAQIDSLTRRVDRLAEVEREVATLRAEVQRAASTTAGWGDALPPLLLAALLGGLLGAGLLHLRRR